MSRYFAKDGRGISLLQWAKLFEDRSYKQLWDDSVGSSRVSTVWLGMDHGFGEFSRPIIFETLVFGGPLDQEMDRYATIYEAEEGHKAMVKRVRVKCET